MDMGAAEAAIIRLRAAHRWNPPPPATAMEILETDRLEIPHSRMVAWLLTPSGSHGLGPRLLKALLTRADRPDLAHTLATDRVHVQREVPLPATAEHPDRRADIVIWADGTPVVIEMKVASKEHEEQTHDLAGHFRALHDAPAFLYLTLDGSHAQDNAFRPMRLLDLAADLRQALHTGPTPDPALHHPGRATAADYLETLERLTHMTPTSRSTAEFWLRHGDDEVFAQAKKAAWALLRRLPELTAAALTERGALTDDLVLQQRLDTVHGERTRNERVVLLGRRDWLTDGHLTAGVGLAVRERLTADDDRWTTHNKPFHGIWIADPRLRKPLLAAPRLTEPWGNWGANWDYFDLALPDPSPDLDPEQTYANRAADLLLHLWTEHHTPLAHLLTTTDGPGYGS
ncbi:PD-(D/E)XK nuclease family protein [Kitasatospora sp. NPDC058162]|uniref:PD-(D/E)XK nuclease family protein n=1 Tax=Kitasatospora sp. NPDC058162 TaxID=3346362 RepID=UPI0036DBF305